VIDSHTSDQEVKSAGATLREARESLGLSLDDASAVTRIGRAYLQALEEEKYERLPSEAYARGFLRGYASYLKIPENEILHLYEKNICSIPADAGDQKLPARDPQDNKRRSLPSCTLWQLIAPILILVLFASWFFLTPALTRKTNTGEPVGIPPAAPPPGMVSSSEPPAVKTEDNQPAVDPGSHDQSREDTAFIDSIPPVTKGLVLKIKVVEDGWLDITIDDSMSQHYELKSGDFIEWKGEKSFTLDIGNAGGIEAEFNGRTMKPFGKSGESVHIMLKADDGES
jgi:cytoskeleton protein RodZ